MIVLPCEMALNIKLRKKKVDREWIRKLTSIQVKQFVQ